MVFRNNEEVALQHEFLHCRAAPVGARGEARHEEPILYGRRRLRRAAPQRPACASKNHDLKDLLKHLSYEVPAIENALSRAGGRQLEKLPADRGSQEDAARRGRGCRPTYLDMSVISRLGNPLLFLPQICLEHFRKSRRCTNIRQLPGMSYMYDSSEIP